MKGVHKYTDIYDGIGLLAIKVVVMVERGVYSISIYISFSYWNVLKITDVYVFIGCIGT